MLSFQDAYVLWLWLPFPKSGKAMELVLAHDDLAVADEYVTTVIRFVENGIFKPAPSSVDVLATLEEIMRRLEVLGGEVAAEERIIAQRQHAYAALLHLVYAEFLRQDPSAG